MNIWIRVTEIAHLSCVALGVIGTPDQAICLHCLLMSSLPVFAVNETSRSNSIAIFWIPTVLSLSVDNPPTIGRYPQCRYSLSNVGTPPHWPG